MNKILIPLKLLVLISVFQFCVAVASAQDKSNNAVLTNESVIELIKAGLSEGIILTKIKNSKTEFDTSSSALVKLKENNVSDTVIMAMLEAKPDVSDEAEQFEKSESSKIAEMKEAVGKRKIFLITEDEESRLELTKKLKDKGFSFVDKKTSAELILELSYAEGTTQQKAGVFRGGNETNFKTKIGKLVMKLVRDSDEYLVYAREYDYAKAANMASLFGISATPPSLHSQVKLYFIDDLLKQMKKAGDKFK